MGKNAAGIAPKVAQNAHNAVKNDLASLESHMSNLVRDVEEMNKSIWYGGKITNKWYNSVKKHYCTGDLNLVAFHKQIKGVQDALEGFFKKIKMGDLFD